MKLRELEISKVAELPFDLKEIYKMLAHNIIGMSWGINRPSLYKDTVLAFKVQGYVHRWWVYITLSYDDTFRIYLTKSNRTSIVKDIKWVYIDELRDVLDSYIEKDKEHYWKQQVASDALRFA